MEYFKRVSDSLDAAEIKPDEAALKMLPNSVVLVPAGKTLQVMRVIDKLEELDDVQHVYSNLDVTEEAVALLETA